jgi:hypothetical protein
LLAAFTDSSNDIVAEGIIFCCHSVRVMCR